VSSPEARQRGLGQVFNKVRPRLSVVSSSLFLSPFSSSPNPHFGLSSSHLVVSLFLHCLYILPPPTSFSPPPQLLSMPGTTCKGSRKGAKPCDCPSFMPRKSKPSKCLICCHREGRHEAIPNSLSDDSDIDAKGGSSYVKRMVTAIKSTSVLERAKQETAQGFRPITAASPVRPSNPFGISPTILTMPTIPA
jgi:hypothetical protein